MSDRNGELTRALSSGSAVRGILPDLAALRLTIFREFPYLYDGRLADELNYLEQYATTPDALVATVRDAGRVIGAATGIPLAAEGAELKDPVRTTSYRVEEIYYLGELLFYQEYRNRGLGLTLLQQVEDAVRTFGDYRYLACATVQRPVDHLARPNDFVPIERFLSRTGFTALGDLVTGFTWQELDGEKRYHPMKYWIKELD
ncbi:GNAT family acetyltransferase [Geomonas limicola]|uniref:GNAT family acetyltransferase n=1 Tax=Geomonas limicola TaxID=2740186 RepID=A0A6V8N3C9_9BACT|nr:GNAT family N-acetyltransferase [Geomonas limicola]GFO66474.1 GNAT family acetyltransferase [Geomonas limicola]